MADAEPAATEIAIVYGVTSGRPGFFVVEYRPGDSPLTGRHWRGPYPTEAAAQAVAMAMRAERVAKKGTSP